MDFFRSTSCIFSLLHIAAAVVVDMAKYCHSHNNNTRKCVYVFCVNVFVLLTLYLFLISMDCGIEWQNGLGSGKGEKQSGLRGYYRESHGCTSRCCCSRGQQQQGSDVLKYKHVTISIWVGLCGFVC